MNEGIIVQILVSITAIIVAYVSIFPQLSSKRKSKQSSLRISRHPFFSRAEMIKHHIDMTFTLENKGKECVFKDIMINQIIIFQSLLSDVCRKVDNGEITHSQELFNLHIDTIDQIMYKHYHYYKNSEAYNEHDKKVLDAVMKKYVIWNKSRIEHLQENIRTVCNSPYYTDIHTQAAVIMDMYMGVMVDTLNNGSVTLGSINGDLKGLKFKNITI